jgi:hypothetical protein
MKQHYEGRARVICEPAVNLSARAAPVGRIDGVGLKLVGHDRAFGIVDLCRYVFRLPVTAVEASSLWSGSTHGSHGSPS